MVRSFIAIDIPKDVQLGIYSFALGSDAIKLVKPTKMHITLAFMDNLTKDELSIAESRLRSISERQFEISLMGIGKFTEEAPRVFYMRVREGYDNVCKLHHNISEAMEESGIKIKRKVGNFVPHLTIGRLRADDASVSEALEFISERNLYEKPFSFNCDSVSLLRSDQGKMGHKYKRLLKVKLSKSY
ncbi:MAG: RNA 2',3'-cyclic phosphodiesterase [Candidatus Marsarchaeota archaeon]|nr:RNA 2',3'-cyclic phosphodiesterase [Candidatus Marsarchaeota archaeon]